MASELNPLTYSYRNVAQLVHEARDSLEEQWHYRLHPDQALRDAKIKKIMINRFIKDGALIEELLAEIKHKEDQVFYVKVFITTKIDILFDLFKHVYKDFTNPELDRLVRQPISGKKPSVLHAKLDALEYANFDPALEKLAELNLIYNNLNKKE